MKDEFVSVEHLFYGLIEKPNAEVGKIFGSAGVDKNAYMKALAEVRGNVRVTSENPEDTYDVLKSGVPNAIRVFEEMREANSTPLSAGTKR